eukprot:3965558-Alexandrium_andersonii.AAC.1
MKPKHHMYDHCLRRADSGRLDPVHHWAMADEDFIGKISRVAAKPHAAQRSHRAAERFVCRVFADIRAQAAAS